MERRHFPEHRDEWRWAGPDHGAHNAARVKIVSRLLRREVMRLQGTAPRTHVHGQPVAAVLRRYSHGNY